MIWFFTGGVAAVIVLFIITSDVATGAELDAITNPEDERLV